MTARRLSTGGKPPRRVEVFMQVESVPTYDNSLCYSAWQAERTYVSLEEPSKSRPKWGLQIYDTTPSCGRDAARLERLALKLYEDTWDTRSGTGRGERDRTDLYALPMEAGLSDEDRVEKCKSHYFAEKEARNAEGISKSDHYIPQAVTNDMWQHSIMIIAQAEETWDEGEGGFIQVKWERKGEAQPSTPEQSVTRWLYEGGTNLGQVLGDMREDVEWFTLHHCTETYEDGALACD